MAKNVACFALPLLCANLVQLLYSATDALFAGNVEGTAGIAAIGASSLAVTCVVSFLSGFSVGSNVLVASKRGAKDEEGLRRVFGTSVLLALLMGALFCVVGIACSDVLVGLMAVPESVHDCALSYLRIYFLALPFIALYDNVASCLRGIGDSQTPLYAQIVGGIVNVILDAVALLVLGLGIDGVAWATFFSQGIAFLFAFLRAKSMLKVRSAIRPTTGLAADLAMRLAQEAESQLMPRSATGTVAEPAMRPAQLATRPVTRPTTRQEASPATQPAARPEVPPATRPATRPVIQSAAKPAVRLGKALTCMDFAIAKEIFTVGFPVAIQALCVTLSNMVIQVAINATGETNVAAFTAYFKIEMLIYAPLVALGQTTTVLAAQNVGAKYHWRVHRGVRCCIAFGATFAVVSAAVLLVFRFSVVALFDQNVEVVAAGGLVMLVLVPVLLDLCIYRGVCGCLSWYRQSERGNPDNVALLCRDASDTPAPRSALRVWSGGNCCHLSVDMAACRLFPGLLLLRLCAQGIASRHTWRLPRMTRIVHCKTWWDSHDWNYRAAESVQRKPSEGAARFA